MQSPTTPDDDNQQPQPNPTMDEVDLEGGGLKMPSETDGSSAPPPSPPSEENGTSDAPTIVKTAPPAPKTAPPRLVSRGSGLLEGMDPNTGDYIRPTRLKPTNVAGNQKSQQPMQLPKFSVEEVGTPTDNNDGPAKDRERQIIGKKLGDPLDPSQLTISSMDARSLKRKVGVIYPIQLNITSLKWSKRLVSTISNKSRTSDEESDDGADNCIFGTQIRFTIMIISTLCLSSILSNILAFNFTYICMAGEQPSNYSEMTDPEEWESLGYHPDLDYNSFERSTLFMAVAVGALLAVFPLTVMLNKFGSRIVFGALGYISAVSTLLVPLSANLGFPALIIMRVIQGSAFSACLPVMGSITSHWSTLKQNGIFIAILSSFLQIAPIFTMPTAGVLCVSELGWQAVYYLHGVVCLIVFTFFILYHRNTPLKHPLVLRKELVKVTFGKGGSIYSGPGKQSKKAKQVPYRAMFHDRAIWAILVAAFGNFMGTQLSLQFVPTYLRMVLFLPIESTGMVSAVSPVIMFCIKLLAGQSSDRIKFISDEAKLRIYNCLSMGLMGTFFIVLAMLDPHKQKSLCMVTLITSTCILGFNSGGFFKSSQMVSRQHSHFTLACISFLNCVCMLLVPLMNELIAPENTPPTWAIVLWIHGIILLTTNLFFCIFASAKPARWTLDSWSNRASVRKMDTKRRVAPTDGGSRGGGDVEVKPVGTSPQFLAPPQLDS